MGKNVKKYNHPEKKLSNSLNDSRRRNAFCSQLYTDITGILYTCVSFFVCVPHCTNKVDLNSLIFWGFVKGPGEECDRKHT